MPDRSDQAIDALGWLKTQALTAWPLITGEPKAEIEIIKILNRLEAMADIASSDLTPIGAISPGPALEIESLTPCGGGAEIFDLTAVMTKIVDRIREEP